MTRIELRKHIKFDRRRHLSELVHDSPNSRVVLFSFEPGQGLEAHTSTSEVIFMGMEGSATVLLGDEETPIAEKEIVVCPPNVPHGLRAAERAAVLAIITPRPG